MKKQKDKVKEEKQKLLIPPDVGVAPKFINGFGLAMGREVFRLNFTSTVADKRFLVGSFILLPPIAKKLFEALREAIKIYEEEYGQIIIEEERFTEKREVNK